LSRLATSFVLGYHGCDEIVAKAVISGKAELKPSQNDFDWLGHGAYFWESDPQRAFEYAEWKTAKGEFKKPAVIGAVIDLRNCLDLTNRSDLDLVKEAYDIYALDQEITDLPLAKNENAKGDPFGDLLLRNLDCAVINLLHYIIDNSSSAEKFDTVRGMFSEGGPLYAGAGYSAKSHTQIAVRHQECIVGYFRPRESIV
jgi:hypothetical protein